MDTRQSPERNRALKKHWAQVGLRHLERAREGHRLYSYNLFAISEAGFDQFRREYIEFLERVRTIAATSRRSERVVLLNHQLILLEEQAMAP